MFVSSCTMEIFAPGITAPVRSLTVPEIAPLSTWPNAADTAANRKTMKRIPEDLFADDSPCSIYRTKASMRPFQTALVVVEREPRGGMIAHAFIEGLSRRRRVEYGARESGCPRRGIQGTP